MSVQDPRDLLSLTFSSVFDVPLQWFAAEDEGRTEEPSEHKIRKAREEGKVARSGEVSSALVLIAGVAALGLLAQNILGKTVQMFVFFFSRAGSPNAFNGGLMNAFMGWLVAIGLPVLAVVFVVAILGNVIQVGFFFTVKPITPDFSRIAPRFGRWLSRSFASPEALFNIAKSMVKIAVIALIAYLNIAAALPQLTRLALSAFLGVSPSSPRSPSASCWRLPSRSSPSRPPITGSRDASTWSP